MSTLKTHNLQSPDASSVNIAMAPNAGIVVTGISTFNNDIKLPDNKKILLGTGSDLEIYHESNISHISNTTGTTLQISNVGSNGADVSIRARPDEEGIKLLNNTGNSYVELYFNGAKKFETTNTGVTVDGTVAATAYTGDGSQLSNLPASAPVGGSSSNKVFFENDKVVSVNYQITSTKNAMTAGPISINAGIGVTVPSGCSWTIV